MNRIDPDEVVRALCAAAQWAQADRWDARDVDNIYKVVDLIEAGDIDAATDAYLFAEDRVSPYDHFTDGAYRYSPTIKRAVEAMNALAGVLA
jgi:hypothetical protein